MNFSIQLPKCPICAAEPLLWLSDFDNKIGARHKLAFRCDATYTRTAKSDFKEPWKNYGPWSAWKCEIQCSNATKVALDLLELHRPPDFQRGGTIE